MHADSFSVITLQRSIFTISRLLVRNSEAYTASPSLYVYSQLSFAAFQRCWWPWGCVGRWLPFGLLEGGGNSAAILRHFIFLLVGSYWSWAGYIGLFLLWQVTSLSPSWSVMKGLSHLLSLDVKMWQKESCSFLLGTTHSTLFVMFLSHLSTGELRLARKLVLYSILLS